MNLNLNLKVTFHSENQRIYGNLHIPAEKEKPPGVLLLHGLESSKDSGKWPSIASRLCSEGYACLRFSFRGCGEGMEKSEGEFEEVTLTARINDYLAALHFLQAIDKVDINRLGVIGSSFGGMTAIAAQAMGIKALVTMGTPYKIPRFEEPRIPKKIGEYYVLPSGRRFKKNFYEDLKKYDLLLAIKSAPPILILHGSLDEVVPLEHAYKLYEAALEPKKLVIVEGADHVFSKHLNRAIDLSLEWFEKYLMQ
ncbi:MAG: alpha/beta fold hydrolase [Halobacteria archaeon]